MRAFALVLEMTPKVLESKFELGFEKFGLLKVLKNSVRKFSPIPSRIGNRFCTAKSRLAWPGPRRTFRPRVPNRVRGAAANALLFSQPESLSFVETLVNGAP